jgi:hypothetical protein
MAGGATGVDLAARLAFVAGFAFTSTVTSGVAWTSADGSASARRALAFPLRGRGAGRFTAMTAVLSEAGTGFCPALVA